MQNNNPKNIINIIIPVIFFDDFEFEFEEVVVGEVVIDDP